LEYGNNLEISLDIRNHRMLTNYDKKNDIIYESYHNKTHDNREYHKLVNRRDSNNTYIQLKRGRPNNVEAYLNSFKYRHSKKSGLKKLDCYYEKKLFNSLDKIEKLAQQKNITEKRIKKIIYKKYVVRFILLTLLPLFGLILPIMYYNTDHMEKENCVKVINAKTRKVIHYLHKKCKMLPPEYRFYNYLFFTSLGLIIILFIIYTYVKILKYKRIKSGIQK
ncbi:Protein of unknown function, putative, partial [Plasmodium vivax]